jgi:antitoxin (DNA-binding transcriptional repressor) of toxin-antitoxin stability system
MQAINLNISISEFRANLLKYLELAKRGEQITITSKGQPLATLHEPVLQKKNARAQLQALAKTAKLQDVLTPTGSEWDALA